MNTLGMMKTAVVGLASALLLLAPACARESAEASPETPGTTASAAAHGNHDPDHGGIISMTADLHIETVLDPAGRHEVHFSDGARQPLPAVALAAVAMRLERRGAQPERLTLDRDARGAFWVAEGGPLRKAALTKVVVTFNRPGEPPTSMPVALPEHAHHEH